MRQANSVRLRSSFLLLMIALVLVMAGCGVNQGKTNNNSNNSQGSGGNGSNATPAATKSPTATPEATEAPSPTPEDIGLLGPEKHPVVTIELSNDKIIKVELYPEIAPNTVNNFVSLVSQGFYDGLIFHRVIPGFMIQGGDPDGNGTGGPGYSIAGEFSMNNFENKLKHTRGVISMARANDPDSAGSQFFIMVADAPSLDNKYASFGVVTEGMDAVDEIVAQDRDAQDKPVEPISMKKVTVDTKDMTFDEPVKVQ
ncbi:peptidylprolyl isomerase [Paenibacillus sp. HB172176]|uniref:peptidylprolyl isomerase n=1 Tax=Paenibacillus sp. HB172176 TaxID=2493690 RepID=UPI0014390A6F|nr:peptidylprolyl isomerase [Paenibacillus sp. HB172176]